MNAIPDFHMADHAALPKWHPEVAACATCTPDEVLTTTASPNETRVQ